MGRDSDSEPESQDMRSHDNYDDEEYTVGKVYESPVERTGRRYTEEEEKRVIKKFDTRLVLFMALLYLLSFLDRSSEYSFFLARFRDLHPIYTCPCKASMPCSSSFSFGIY